MRSPRAASDPRPTFQATPHDLSGAPRKLRQGVAERALSKREQTERRVERVGAKQVLERVGDLRVDDVEAAPGIEVIEEVGLPRRNGESDSTSRSRTARCLTNEAPLNASPRR